MVSPARSQSNPAPTPRTKRRAALASESRPKPRALVVDPDATAGTRLSRVLGALGFDVHTLRDAARALSAVSRRAPHVVFLDVSDTDASLDGKGLRALREMRAADEGLQVVCMSREPDVQVAVEVIRERALDYVTKPLGADRVDALTQEVLDRCGLLEDVEERLHAEVGSRVRFHRKSLGYTLQQVADRTGLSVSLISQIELGKSGASLLSLHRLARALEVPMASFLADD
ncbi:MAG: response regulator [Myxococcota bacterium]|nr:response regulator [Myxococcota bacterium]